MCIADGVAVAVALRAWASAAATSFFVCGIAPPVRHSIVAAPMKERRSSCELVKKGRGMNVSTTNPARRGSLRSRHAVTATAVRPPVRPGFSPPLALERAVGPTGLVERVELCHVVVGEAEVEDLRVLLDPLAVRRLRDDRDVVLDGPAQEDLRRRPVEARGDLRDDRL